MFVSKKTHEKELKRVTDASDLVISNLHTLYSDRINDLLAQIADLRQLVFPKKVKEVEPVVLEADNVISGSEKPYEVSEEEHNRYLEQAREMDLLISGNYAEDYIQ